MIREQTSSPTELDPCFLSKSNVSTRIGLGYVIGNESAYCENRHGPQDSEYHLQECATKHEHDDDLLAPRHPSLPNHLEVMRQFKNEQGVLR